LCLLGRRRCVASAVLVLLLCFGLVFDLVLIVNWRGALIIVGQDRASLVRVALRACLNCHSPFQSPLTAALQTIICFLSIYMLQCSNLPLYSHHCLFLPMHAIVSWCPFSSVLESTIVRFPGKVASALLPQLTQLTRLRLIYALPSRGCSTSALQSPFLM
jgi:hypothetical protein